jgi:alpha-mannosidase
MLPHQDINTVTVVNTLPWERSEVIELLVEDHRRVLYDSQGMLEGQQSWKDRVLRARVKVPSMGYATFHLAEGNDPMQLESGVVVTESLLENDKIRVVLGDNGALVSLYDKSLKREMLEGNGANRLLLFADKPYRYDAWDISAYYREVAPQQALLESRETLPNLKESRLFCRLWQQRPSICCWAVLPNRLLRSIRTTFCRPTVVIWKDEP